MQKEASATERALLVAARSLLPPGARQALRIMHRRLVFRRALSELWRDPAAVAAAPRDVLSNLVYGWGNEGWSGHQEYLKECLRYALACKGPMLECGSGLTTILLGVVAHRLGLEVWSLEHMPEWGERVRRQLDGRAVKSVHLCVDALRDYGGFEWYQPPLAAMPDHFALVICDGPPADTRGGRYGLVSVMRRKIGPGCVILLDDAARDQEREIARRWSRELPLTCELRGRENAFFVMQRASNESVQSRRQPERPARGTRSRLPPGQSCAKADGAEPPATATPSA